MSIHYEEELNEEQLAAVKATGTVLILAGAGSGKTRTLVYRVAYLIEHGVMPENILLLTFTNKAANEMKSRAEVLLDERCRGITASTFHSFCCAMLRKYAWAIGIDFGFSILSPSDEAQAIDALRTEMNLHKLRDFPNARKLLNIYSAMVNKNISLPDAMAESGARAAYSGYIDTVRKMLTEYKRTRNLVSYDDMLVLFRDMIRDNRRICREISKTYKYIMVDEYQDTNYIQNEIIFLMRQDSDELAVVGDDAQSLYAFRGADVQNIIEFENRVQNCRVITLFQNYRSTQEILDLSNRVMKLNMTEGIYKEMKAVGKYGDKPVAVHVGSSGEEASDILDKVTTAHIAGVPLSDMAVLARTSAQTYILEAELARADIPFVKYGGQTFLEKACVRNVIAYLRVATNAFDEISWYCILQNYFGIGKTYSRSLAALAPDKGYELLTSNPYTKHRFSNDLKALRKKIEEWQHMELRELITDIIEHYYAVNKIRIEKMRVTDEARRQDALDENEADHEELKALLDLADGYTEVVKFLDSLELGEISADKDVTDRLVLSTIHSAKGLEFTNVFIMDCVEGVFPDERKLPGSKEENEELRCLYVAITRAKDHLYIYMPDSVSKFGRSFYTVESRFFCGSNDLMQDSWG